MAAPAFRRLRRAAAAAAGLLLASAGAPCGAVDASPWDKGTHSAARLIGARAVREQNGTELRAGIEITLRPQWKTYWRHPGDSGVPPRFDFTRSENVKDVRVLWPAPRRFADGGGYSIGYAEHIVFPLRIVAAEEDKPAVLRVHVDYGVCEKLCVPAEARLELPLPHEATAHDAVLAASEARVPKSAAVGAREPLAVIAMRRESGPGNPRLMVDIATSGNLPVDLFAEGPTAEWALPLPQPIDGAAAGVQRFAVDLDGAPPGTEWSGALLKLTAVSASAAIEVPVRLD